MLDPHRVGRRLVHCLHSRRLGQDQFLVIFPLLKGLSSQHRHRRPARLPAGPPRQVSNRDRQAPEPGVLPLGQF
jgi:hypothetical protein